MLGVTLNLTHSPLLKKKSPQMPQNSQIHVHHQKIANALQHDVSSPSTDGLAHVLLRSLTAML